MQFIVPISQPGGKVMDIKKPLAYFPKQIKTYVEPFMGSGALGFRLLYEQRITKQIIFNDINKDLINFWTDLKNNNIVNNYPNVQILTIDQVKVIYNNIPKFNKQGWEYLFQNRLGWSGRENTTFSTTRYNLKYYDCLKRVKYCEQLLNTVPTKIYNQDYETIIQKYDSFETLFYLDPPYYQVCKNLYKHENIDFQKLLMICQSIKGRFILSLNDHPTIRLMFQEFNQYQWEKVYHMRHKNKAKEKGKELIIMNFKKENLT